jgi:hypothetical protein
MVAVGPTTETLDAQGEPIGEVGQLVQKAFRRVADDLAWWSSAARNECLREFPPYRRHRSTVRRRTISPVS